MTGSIEFLATYGDEQKEVELFAPVGASDGYQVLVNRRYHGTILKYNGEWIGHLNPNSDITGADILILGDIIDAHHTPAG
jgi:hypothetical protein